MKAKSGFIGFSLVVTVDGEPVEAVSQAEQIPTLHWFLCGWPLVLVFFGGALGGGLGGAAFAVNLSIRKSNLPLAGKVALNIGAGFGAFVLWIIAATIVALLAG